MYNPTPIDTSDVILPEEILLLAEAIAKNVHNVWAKARTDEGWIYGVEKNSITKETPCLVPYEELPDSEKEYDRNTALETLKLIMKMGYTISNSKD